MKSSTSVNRSLASILALASTAIFSLAGVAHAQYTDSTSGQGSSAGQSGSTSGARQQPREEPFSYDILEEPMDQGYVDQEKRAGRAKDPRSPSPEDHVPEFPVDEQGRPLKDPKYEQGGPIGPN